MPTPVRSVRNRACTIPASQPASPPVVEQQTAERGKGVPPEECLPVYALPSWLSGAMAEAEHGEDSGLTWNGGRVL